ncbi:unnamed protein product [Symbiodinium natans]|uniref:Uncharacterized protein n=1 Tax=Symbiodinium natans TaxID=878477 RepID=A0A812I9T1_9DINO|nr:unnamed protein product [Symbiodinium natans]
MLKSNGSYGYTPVGRTAAQKAVMENHKQSMFILGIGLLLILIVLTLAFCYTWYSTKVPLSCTAPLSLYFWLAGISNFFLAVLLVIGMYLMQGMMLAVSHHAVAQIMEEHAQTYSIAGGQHSVSAAAHRSEFQESALHYGGGMTAVLVLQSVVMLAQIGLGIYGIVQVLQVQRADDGYLCGESINVFWTLLGLHFIQNTCVVGKLSKGLQHHPRGIDEDVLDSD